MTLSVKRIQIGDSTDPLKNFTLRQPNVADGTLVLSRGNADNPGATIFTVNPQGAILLPDGSMVGGNAWRNRIINGDMRIDQRNSGAEYIGPLGANYSIDRWAISSGIANTLSVTRATNANGLAASSGTTTAAYITVKAARTPAAGDYFNFNQPIEGFNVADFRFGSADAKAFTVSFLVSASVVGTYSAKVSNGALNRSYVFTFSLPTANTYYLITKTIPGDTLGTWVTDTGIGMYLMIDLGHGTNYETTTTDSWQAGDFRRTSGSVKLVNTLNANMIITNVQVEAGSVATPFERRDYSDELRRCQRYCQVDGATNIVTAYNQGVLRVHGFRWPTMRAAPTITSTFFYDIESGAAITAPSCAGVTAEGFPYTTAATGAVAGNRYGWTQKREAEL